MDITLPSWLDAPKIFGIGILVLLITQYFKDQIPAKFTKIFAVLLGVGLSIGCDCYVTIPKAFNIVKAIIDGLVAAVMADFGYSFLSKKGGGPFMLPSRKEDPPKEETKPIDTVKKIVPVILIFFLLTGCAGVQSNVQNLQSDLFAWDDANAANNVKFMEQAKKHWGMNSAAMREFIGPKLLGEEYYKLRYALDELDKLLIRDTPLTEAEVGRGIVLFGKFLYAGGQAAADEYIPKLVALFKEVLKL